MDKNSDEEEHKKRQIFMNELEIFYKRKYNCQLRPARINGARVDLFRLYNKVASLGGLSKVTVHEKWREVVEFLNLPLQCCGIEHAVKMLFLRYLARFHQMKNFGEDHDEIVDSVGFVRSSRSRNSLLSLTSTIGSPMVAANKKSSNDPNRASDFHSAYQIAEHTPYVKLVRSLQSGLPNEVNFALNVCLAMSSSASTTCKTVVYREFPSLVDLLLAHAGFFQEGDDSYKSLYLSDWKSNFKVDVLEFWHDNLGIDLQADLSDYLDTDYSKAKWMNPIETKFSQFFNVSDLGLEAKKLAKNKVLMIATLLRNFSFEPNFKTALASNKALLRFLIISIHCQNGDVNSLAWDLLSNLATDIDLEQQEAHFIASLLNALDRALNSDDKFHLIRALETFGGLCSSENNQSHLLNYFDRSFLDRIYALMTLKDVMICIHMLECLYSMTEIGSEISQKLSMEPKLIDSLVYMATVETVSFGQNGLNGMKVVEYGAPRLQNDTNKTMLPLPSVSLHRPSSQHGHPPASACTMAPPNWRPPLQPPPQRPVNSGAFPANAGLRNAIHTYSGSRASAPEIRNLMAKSTPNTTFPGYQAGQATLLTTAVAGRKKDTPQTSSLSQQLSINVEIQSPATTSKKSKIKTVEDTIEQCKGPSLIVQQDEQAETWARNWLKQNCSVDPTSTVTRAALYAAYVQDIAKPVNGVNTRMPVSVNTFANLIRLTFPACHLKQLNSTCHDSKSPIMQINGIKFALSSTNVKQNSSAVDTNHDDQDSQNQNNNCSINNANSVTMQHPLTQQILERKAPAPMHNSLNSKLISLLSERRNEHANNEEAKSSSEARPVLSRNDQPFSPTGDSGMPILNGQSSSGASPCKSPSLSSLPNGVVKPTPPQQNKNFVSPNSGKVDSPPVLSSFVSPPASNCATAPPATDHSKNNGNDQPPVDSSTENSRDDSQTGSCYSPDPSMERVKENLEKSQENIQEYLTNSIVSSTMDDIMQPKSLLRKRSRMKPQVKDTIGDTVDFVRINSQLIEASPMRVKNVYHARKRLQMSNNNICSENVTTNSNSTSGRVSPLSTSNSSSVDSPVPGLIEPKFRGKKRKNSTDSAASDLPSIHSSIKTVIDEVIDSVIPSPAVNSGPIVKRKYPKKGFKSPLPMSVEPTSQSATTSACSSSVLSASQAFYAPSAQILPSSTVLPSSQISNQATVQLSSTSMIPPASTSVATGFSTTTNVYVLKYACEWENCEKLFDTIGQVVYHVSKEHLPIDTFARYLCKWARCDKFPRKKWSLMAHVQDVHCNERALKLSALRRHEIIINGMSKIPEFQAPPSHPGYPADAAAAAIRRHAFTHLQKDVTEENEGPVTKSIRLASCLILRNLARKSSRARKILLKYESILCWLAFSRLESSTTLAQCLAELHKSTFIDYEEDETTDQNEI